MTTTSQPSGRSRRATASPVAASPITSARDSLESRTGGSRRRRCRRRARRRSPENSQKRTITVNSDQPPTSKWWWIGAMRSTRRRKPRYEMTCAITDSVSMSGSPREDRQQAAGCASSSASPAIAPPIASEPVSPMMIRAGAAFHHRNPAHAPTIAAATIAMVERLRRQHPVDLGWRNSVNAMIDERGEHERRRTRGEAVEPVGEVHRVRRRVDDDDRPHEPTDRPEVEVERPREREVRRHLHPVERERSRTAARRRGCRSSCPACAARGSGAPRTPR